MPNRQVLAAVTLATLLAACADRAPTEGASVASAKKAVAPPGAAVVMSGLNSPRGLEFGPEGALYVAEAGTAAINGPCVTIARGQNCYSGTGAISRLWKGAQTRLASGLPSFYNPATVDIGGPNDISFQGRGNGYVSISWGADPALRSGLGAVGAQFGTLIRVKPNGKWDVAADVAALEGAENPAGGPIDSNPYGLLAEGGRQFVTDAGGNSLVEVRANGATSSVAVFPSIPVPPLPLPFPLPPRAEAVPTEVVRGPDGALYVSTLTGFPFLPGAASIYRVVPGQAPEVYESGFTTITDFDWGPDGSLYVVQYASALLLNGPGSVIRVAPNHGARTTIAAGLEQPTGVVVGPDGAVYVSNRGTVPGGGEVRRYTP